MLSIQRCFQVMLVYFSSEWQYSIYIHMYMYVFIESNVNLLIILFYMDLRGYPPLAMFKNRFLLHSS